MEWSVIGTGLGVVGFTYTFLRNFKADIKEDFKRLEKRMDGFEERMNHQDDRIFFAMTGKSLSAAILEEKLKASTSNIPEQHKLQ